jgi:Zn-dependent M28 family amino/carboxypeptidase
MKRRFFFKHFPIATVLCATIFCVAIVSVKSTQVNLPEDDLTLSEVESHLRFIASDELMGRKPGTYGADIAARYIAEQFRAAGLQTVQGASDYFQEAHLIMENKPKGAANTGILKPVISKNVIGYVEGKDPGMANECVLLCAHYDHLGTGRFKGSTDTDIIFNGARDNGMGTVALICAAKALALKPTSRSVVLIAFTGEEEGCLGSKYFVENPLIPLEKIVFVLNNDGGGFNVTHLIRIAGLERVSQKERIKKAADKYGLSALPYPSELQYLYQESDNMPFACKGIPAVTVSPGFDKVDEEIRKYIHTVDDEAGDTFNYTYLLQFTRAYISIARALGNTPTL